MKIYGSYNGHMNNNRINPNKQWSAEDRQNFADRNFLKSLTVPNKKRIANKKACRGRLAWD